MHVGFVVPVPSLSVRAAPAFAVARAPPSARAAPPLRRPASSVSAGRNCFFGIAPRQFSAARVPRPAATCEVRAEAPAATTSFDINEVIERIKREGAEPFEEDAKEATFDIYDDDVYYQDPTTKIWGKPAFLAMINSLKSTSPKSTLKFLRMTPTGPRTISARWTMSFSNPKSWKMPFWVTGETTYTLNEAGKVIAHVDAWDSLPREPAAWQAIFDMTKQIVREQVMKKANVEEPPNIVVRRFAEYEVREYERFVEAEVAIAGNPLGGSSAFQSLAGYIFGRNEREEKMAMTAPVFSTYEGPDADRAARMAFVMESKFDTPQLPRPADSSIQLVERPKERFAVLKFSGVALGPVVARKKRELEGLLERDGIAVVPGAQFRLAQYNDPSTPPFRRRNEVLIPVQLAD
eukprot:tig00020961_g16757.t1